MRKPIFEKLFDVAEYSKMKTEDKQMYDVSLKRKWDAYSMEQTRIILEERAVARGLDVIASYLLRRKPVLLERTSLGR